MNKKAKKTKQRILKTAASIIAKKGLDKITIRELSKLAKVNIAAVNYYYESKEKLLQETVVYVSSLIDKSFDFLSDENIDPKERLRKCLKDYTKIMCKNKGYIKTIISHLNNKYYFSEYISDIVAKEHEKVLNVLQEISPEISLSEVKQRTLQVMSAVNYPLIIGEFCQNIYEFDFFDENERNLFIDNLIESWTSK